MLESSGMPAVIDNVLSEGFNPRDWTIKATRSSSQLSLTIAKQYREIKDFKEVMGFLRKVHNIENVVLPLSIEQEDIQKIKKILRWNDIKTTLTESNIKMLAFLWYSVFVLESANSFPLSTELFPKLSNNIWNALEGVLGTNKSILLMDFEKTVEKLVEKEITWAVDILRLPEVV